MDWKYLITELVNERIDSFSEALEMATARLKNAMSLNPSDRKWNRKTDGSSVTEADIDINLALIEYVRARHRFDQVKGEEVKNLSLNGPVSWHIDPVDNTHHYRLDDFSVPGLKKNWVAVMMSLSVLGYHRMFGISFPQLNQIYSGCEGGGIFLNNHPFEVKFKNTGLLIGLNEPRHSKLLEGLTGYNDIHMACLEGWLILQGIADGGCSSFNKLHEHGCLTAIARCIPGVTVTDMLGNPHNSGTDLDHSQYSVWSRDGMDHDMVISLAWQKLMNGN